MSPEELKAWARKHAGAKVTVRSSYFGSEFREGYISAVYKTGTSFVVSFPEMGKEGCLEKSPTLEILVPNAHNGYIYRPEHIKDLEILSLGRSIARKPVPPDVPWPKGTVTEGLTRLETIANKLKEGHRAR